MGSACVGRGSLSGVPVVNKTLQGNLAGGIRRQVGRNKPAMFSKVSVAGALLRESHS